MFTHLKSEKKTEDKNLLLTAVLSDAINLGLRKMAESSPDISYAKLSQQQAWYIRDETYSLALANIVNDHHKHPFSAYWGEGKTLSSDGHRFATTSHAGNKGQVNPKYGSEPGAQYYTHISDQYSPFHSSLTEMIRDSTYMIDGLLYHDSDIEIEEHYTDTAGFTDHVFALMYLLGFRFSPRIKDLSDKKIICLLVIKIIPDYQNILEERLISKKSLKIEMIFLGWPLLLKKEQSWPLLLSVKLQAILDKTDWRSLT